MDFEWTTDGSAGSWIVERTHGFAENVGSIVPHGFDAYAKILHPPTMGPRRRWADLAVANGHVLDPEMDFETVASPAGDPLVDPAYGGPLDGTLPDWELAILLVILRRHTADPKDCWFAVWDGWGQLSGGSTIGYVAAEDNAATPLRTDLPADGDEAATSPALVPAEVLRKPALRLANREYVLARGHLNSVRSLTQYLEDQSPSLWWPAGQTWCVATEVDFAWTYVGASEDLITEILASPDIETVPTTATNRP